LRYLNRGKKLIKSFKTLIFNAGWTQLHGLKKQTLNLIKACIFDLDGVIVDTAHYHFLAWKRLAHELGFELTPDDNERLKGVSRMESLNIVLEVGGITASDHDREVMANKKNTWFVDYVERMMPEEIFPGVKQLIRDLKGNGIKVGLASSSKNAKTVIQLLHIQNEFDAVVDGTMIRNSKPDPEIFLLASSKLGVPPEECLVFEDAEAGVDAALAAGMKCVGVGDARQLSHAHEVVAKTADFNVAEISKL
jgi:beta-phosphoglucomutase